MKPRTIFQYGSQNPPHHIGETWIESEAACNDYGQFRRRARARHSETRHLVDCRCDLPDTFFSIPATTDTQHGYITSGDDGYEFRPHTNQTQTPKAFRASLKKAYK